MIKTKDYSTALADALVEHGATKADELLKKTRELLRSRGHEDMYAPVVRGATRLVERRLKTEGAEVILAAEKEGAKHRDSIAADLATARAIEYRTRIDHSLIGGYVVTAGGVRKDRSVRHALVELYGALTSEK